MELYNEKIFALFLGFISVILPIVFYFLSRTNKILDCEISSNTIIDITKDGQIGHKLEVFYDKEPISKLDLVNLKLYNTGSAPVSSKDFETDISIQFSQNAKIFEPEIIENKQNINPEITVNDNSILIKPFLLNKGENIEIQTLISGFIKNDIHVISRIVGCKIKLKTKKD